MDRSIRPTSDLRREAIFNLLGPLGGNARRARGRLSGFLRERRLPAARYSRRSNRSLRKLARPCALKSRRRASSSYSSRTQSRNGRRPSASA